jgi:hypothetical protein
LSREKLLSWDFYDKINNMKEGKNFFSIKRKINSNIFKRSIFWYFLFFLIITLFFLSALYLKNILFALLIVLFTIVYWFEDQREKEEKIIKIEITPEGLKINKEPFSFKKDFISFEIFENKKANFPFTLRLDFKNKWRGALFIPLKKDEKEKIEEVLKEKKLNYLKKGAENFLENLREILKI